MPFYFLSCNLVPSLIPFIHSLVKFTPSLMPLVPLMPYCSSSCDLIPHTTFYLFPMIFIPFPHASPYSHSLPKRCPIPLFQFAPQLFCSYFCCLANYNDKNQWHLACMAAIIHWLLRILIICMPYDAITLIWGSSLPIRMTMFDGLMSYDRTLFSFIRWPRYMLRYCHPMQCIL